MVTQNLALNMVVAKKCLKEKKSIIKVEWSCSVFLYLYPYFLSSNFYQYHQGCNSFGFLRPLKMIVNIKVECIVTILILLQIDDPSQGKQTTIFEQYWIKSADAICLPQIFQIRNRRSALIRCRLKCDSSFQVP